MKGSDGPASRVEEGGLEALALALALGPFEQLTEAGELPFERDLPSVSRREEKAGKQRTERVSAYSTLESGLAGGSSIAPSRARSTLEGRAIPDSALDLDAMRFYVLLLAAVLMSLASASAAPLRAEKQRDLGQLPLTRSPSSQPNSRDYVSVALAVPPPPSRLEPSLSGPTARHFGPLNFDLVQGAHPLGPARSWRGREADLQLPRTVPPLARRFSRSIAGVQGNSVLRRVRLAHHPPELEVVSQGVCRRAGHRGGQRRQNGRELSRPVVLASYIGFASFVLYHSLSCIISLHPRSLRQRLDRLTENLSFHSSKTSPSSYAPERDRFACVVAAASADLGATSRSLDLVSTRASPSATSCTLMDDSGEAPDSSLGSNSERWSTLASR